VTQIQCRRRPVFDEDFLEEMVSKQPGVEINTIKDPYKGSNTTIITTKTNQNYECNLCNGQGDHCNPYFIADEKKGIIKKKCHSASSGDKAEIVYIQESDTIDHNNSFNDILKRLVREFYTTFKNYDDKDSEHYVETKNMWLNSTLRFMNNYVVKIEAAKPCVNIRKFRENLTGQSVIGWEMMAAMDFMKSYCEYKIEGDSLAKLWFESTVSGDNKRSFTVCNPSVDDPHAHNTFSGLHISYLDSLKGDLKKGQAIADFIKRVWCDNDDTVFQYTIKWLSWQIQKPGELCETAIFIRGSPGSGKSSIINMLLTIIGEHSVATSDTDNVFGNFNSLLRSKFLCYLDEAVFAGDKRIEGKIKAAITEPTRMINIKGIPQYAERNCTNFIASSNNEHFLRVEEKSRRFLVLETSDEMLRWDNKQKSDLLNNGALNFARYLYEVDLNGWDRRSIPTTNALKTQRAYCQSPMNNWLLNLANGLEHIQLDKHVSLVDLFESYSVYDRHTILAVFSKKIRTINFNGKPLFTDEKRVQRGGKRMRFVKTPDERLLEKYNNLNL
jgi:hypothetical protein